MKELKFSLKLKEIPVQITAVDGSPKSFVLRELNGRGRDEYLNEMGGRMKFNAEGKTEGLSDYRNLMSGLLSQCLYDEENKLVDEKTLQEYPASVLSDLFDAAQELSALDKGAAKEAKNVSKVKS